MRPPRACLLLLASAALACGAHPQPAPRAEPPAAPSAAQPPSPVARAEEPQPACDGETFGLAPGADAAARANADKKRGTAGLAKTRMVATSHARATEAGLAVLRSGGTAADAFVAAALVQDVVFPGVTSTAGLTGILVYDAKTKALTYIHGGLADPVGPARRLPRGEFASGRVESGRLVLVPGAPAAYAEVVRRFGRKSLREDVEPAAALAADGFAIDALYAAALASNRAKLEASSFGRAAFFRGGRVLAEGDTLKLAATAATLRSFGKDARWFSRGPWVAEAVRTANEHGGTLDARDFVAYSPEVGAALHARFAGYDVYAGGWGGATLLSSLQALDQLRGGAPARSFLESPDELELLLRVASEQGAAGIRELVRRGLVTDGSSADALVASAASFIVDRARQRVASAPASPPGSHSSAVIAVDDEGNVVVGTHTIEAVNWGEGLFAGGIPLSTAAGINLDDPTTASLAQRSDSLSDTIVLKDGAPRAALAVYGSGLFPADVEVLDALLARGVDEEQAVLEPRVGGYALDVGRLAVDGTRRLVDPRFDAGLLCQLKTRGFTLARSMPGVRGGYVDTGFPTLVTIAPGRLRGVTPDAPHIHGLAAGD